MGINKLECREDCNPCREHCEAADVDFPTHLIADFSLTPATSSEPEDTFDCDDFAGTICDTDTNEINPSPPLLDGGTWSVVHNNDIVGSFNAASPVPVILSDLSTVSGCCVASYVINNFLTVCGGYPSEAIIRGMPAGAWPASGVSVTTNLPGADDCHPLDITSALNFGPGVLSAGGIPVGENDYCAAIKICKTSGTTYDVTSTLSFVYSATLIETFTGADNTDADFCEGDPVEGPLAVGFSATQTITAATQDELWDQIRAMDLLSAAGEIAIYSSAVGIGPGPNCGRYPVYSGATIACGECLPTGYSSGGSNGDVWASAWDISTGHLT